MKCRRTHGFPMKSVMRGRCLVKRGWAESNLDKALLRTAAVDVVRPSPAVVCTQISSFCSLMCI